MIADNTAPPFRIVVIEDDHFQIHLLENILRQEGYEVIGYADSREALDGVRSQIPDLILTDLIMPGLDGFEVIRNLKAEERTRNIPVVLVTAKNDPKTESNGFELGAVDYITKPLSAPIVKARVRAHLELKRHRDDLERLVQQRTAELDSSQRQFQDLVEESLVGIAIIQDQRVVYQNPECKRIIPNLRQSVADQDFSFIHEGDLLKLKQAYSGLASQATPQIETDIRILVTEKPGSVDGVTWINCRAVKFTYQGRDAILVNIVDITHTKELEQLLLLRNKMASLGRIASGMAHEIRNPLTGITSYLYTLEQLCQLETLLPKDVALMNEIIGQLKLASHKVDAVIKRVLDFSKPTAPKMIKIDINQCLNNVLQLTAVTLRKAGIQVNIDLAPEMSSCYGDVALIEQVFLNLIQNAASAVRSAKREKQIQVLTYVHSQQIHVTVADSGPGVPLDLREKIFDPFFTTRQDGSGIGLSIAQRIVTDHSGSLMVQDSELGGAMFTVVLPIEKRKFQR